MHSLKTLLAKNYNLSPRYIGLCYLPFTLGGLTTRWTKGLLADRLLRCQTRRVGEEIQFNRNSPTELQRIPIEKACLSLGLLFIYLVDQLVSAGAVAAVTPLIETIGIGWVGVLLAVLMVMATPAL